MSVWSKMRLGEVAEVVSGPAFKSNAFTDDPIDERLLRGINVGVGEIKWSDIKYWPKEAADDVARFQLRTGDVVLAMDRPWIEAGLKVASVRDADIPALLVQRVARLRAKGSLVQGFLRAVTGTQDFREYLRGITGGTAVPHISANDIRSFLIGIPPLSTQRRIGATVAAFDELIEINERRIELLEDLARSLYREWFVHFRFPGHENVEFADSELGPIPEGWNVYAIGEVAKLRYGKSLTAKTRRPGDIAVVSSAGIIDEHDQMLVEGPGVVVGRKGNVGSVWWVEGPFFPIDTTYYVESDLPLGFLYWLLSGVDFIDSHAAVPGLSREQAMGVRVVIPPADIVQRFDEANAAMFRDISGCRARSTHLVATRDLLLPRLVSGQLDISDVDLGVLTPAEAE